MTNHMTAPNVPNRPLEVLLVEDSQADIRLTIEAFKSSQLPVTLSVVTDGHHALAFLRRRNNYSQAPRPDLVLLDLKMPRKGGHAVLKDVKQDETLKEIPVIVLTTSDDERDVRESYKLYANCYITKPNNYQRFKDIVREIEEFWFRTVTLPSR